MSQEPSAPGKQETFEEIEDRIKKIESNINNKLSAYDSTSSQRKVSETKDPKPASIQYPTNASGKHKSYEQKKKQYQ